MAKGSNDLKKKFEITTMYRLIFSDNNKFGECSPFCLCPENPGECTRLVLLLNPKEFLLDFAGIAFDEERALLMAIKGTNFLVQIPCKHLENAKKEFYRVFDRIRKPGRITRWSVNLCASEP